MRRWFGFGALGIAVGILAVGQPTLGQEAAQTKKNWQCKIDIKVPGINPPLSVTKTVFYTTNTTKQCPGNTSTTGGTAQVTIDCETTVPGWSGPAQSNSAPFECGIYRDPCGQPGLLSTMNASLQINGQGVAKLRCTCAPTIVNGNIVCSQ